MELVVSDRKQLEERYGIKHVEGFADTGIIRPRYNIAPSAQTPIVTEENSEVLQIGHWGFLPSWASEKKDAREVINARAETVQEKPYFRTAIEKRRCLIPVTGFFEWKRDGKRSSPYRFFTGNNIFSLAGIYTMIPDTNDHPVPHFAIVTTTANELMAPVHNRMPVIIDRNDESDWLSDALSDSDIAALLKPYPAGSMQSYEISALVNNPRHDSPEIIKPV
jgi:putative SOS response-associated peptidase YedK